MFTLQFHNFGMLYQYAFDTETECIECARKLNVYVYQIYSKRDCRTFLNSTI